MVAEAAAKIAEVHDEVNWLWFDTASQGGANVIYKCLTILHLRGGVEITVRFVGSEPDRCCSVGGLAPG